MAGVAKGVADATEESNNQTTMKSSPIRTQPSSNVGSGGVIGTLGEGLTLEEHFGGR